MLRNIDKSFNNASSYALDLVSSALEPQETGFITWEVI